MAVNGAAIIRPSVSDPQDIQFKFKTRTGSFEWGGMWPDGDQSAAPDNRPRLLLNTRIKNGRYVRRGGQVKCSDAAITGAKVVGLTMFQIARPYSLYYIQDGCPSISATVGYSIGAFDFEQSPYAQPLSYKGTISSNYAIAPFSDSLYGAKDNQVIQLQLFRAPFGGTTVTATGTSMEVNQFLLPGVNDYASVMQAFDGYLFISAIDTGGPAGEVLSYDGVTVRVDRASAANVLPTGAGLYQDYLILGYNGSPNYISRRDRDGTWTNIAPAAGTVAMLGPHTSASYRNVFYFAGNTNVIWGYDGTTLAAVSTATTGLNASALVKDLCVHEGSLFVLWEYANHSAAGILKYDGTTWTPVHKNLKTQFSALNGAYKIVSFDGVLFVAASETSAGGCFYVSPPMNTAGTYVKHTLTSPSGQIFDAMAF